MMSTYNSNYAIIRFKCVYHTQFGEILWVCGNIEEFGKWDPTKAIEMRTTKDTYPTWTNVTEISLPVSMKFSYKYVIFNPIHNTFSWEKLPNNVNREFSITSPGEFILNDEEGKATQIFIERIQADIIQEDFGENSDFGEDFGPSIRDNSQLQQLRKHELLSNLSYDNNQFARQDINDFQFSPNQKMNPDDRIIISTALLPFKVKRCHSSSEKYCISLTDDYLIYSIMYRMKETNICDVIWIGMLKNFNEFSDEELSEIEEFLQERSIYMISVTDIEYRDYWTYVNKILSPVFVSNTFDMTNTYFRDYKRYFTAYLYINRVFGKKIHAVMQENDLVMINDIHLMFIPNELLAKNSNARVGIYFHTAFPSSDVLKSFPHHQEILKSILLCDVIGFHVYSLAHNFMTACKRIFGIFYKIKFKGFITLDYLGRIILLHIMHAGLDIDYVNSVFSSSEFKESRLKFKELIGDRFSLVSQDIYQDSSGILHKLEAYNRFLTTHKQVKDKIILVQIITKEEKGDWDKNIEEQVNLLTKEIIDTHGEDVLKIVEVSTFSVSERFALFSVGSCLYYLQMREGGCMYVNEYILIQDLLNSENLERINFGIIISENVGVSNVIKGAYRVNPFNINSITQALNDTYTMKQEEKIIKFKKDIDYVKKTTTYSWIKAFLTDIKRTSSQSSKKMGIGMNLGYCLMKFSSHFQKLIKSEFLDAYKNTNNRVFFINYEGTLQKIDENTDIFSPKYAPEARVLKILASLTSDPKNTVFIVSGNTKNNLQEWFSKIKNLNIAAEQGFFYCINKNQENSSTFNFNDGSMTWNELFHVDDWTWKDRAYQILEAFTEKTEGSKIIQKEAILTWDYLNCDLYFGNIQAYEVATHLSTIFENTKLFINHARDYLEIKPRQLTKGYFLSQMLKNEFSKPQNQTPDFIFALGDDQSDEDMFKYIFSIKDQLAQFCDTIKVFPCTIGHKPSAARYFLNEVPEVLEYLESLGKPMEKFPFKGRRETRQGTIERGLKRNSESNNELNYMSPGPNQSSSIRNYLDNSSQDY